MAADVPEVISVAASDLDSKFNLTDQGESLAGTSESLLHGLARTMLLALCTEVTCAYWMATPYFEASTADLQLAYY